jgi:hypothetical protein
MFMKTLKKLRDAGCEFGAEGNIAVGNSPTAKQTPKTPRKRKTLIKTDDASDEGTGPDGNDTPAKKKKTPKSRKPVVKKEEPLTPTTDNDLPVISYEQEVKPEAESEDEDVFMEGHCFTPINSDAI